MSRKLNIFRINKVNLDVTIYNNKHPTIMLINESLIESDGDYEKFLLLLEKRETEGKNYLSLKKIPHYLHSKLIEEGYIIKREVKITSKFLFGKKTSYYYRIEKSNKN